MSKSSKSTFLSKAVHWAEGQSDILAMILVGSQARGNAKWDSDIDLVIVCNSPKDFLNEKNWIREFGMPARTVVEDWGLMTSVRVWFEDSGLEVEFGFTSKEWIKEPLDAGTKRVIDDGYRILVVKSDTLASLFTVG